MHHINPYEAIFWWHIPLHSPKRIGLNYMVGTSNQSGPEMAIDMMGTDSNCD